MNQHRLFRLGLYALSALLGAILFSAVMAHADSRLPFSITCDDVVRYAGDLNIPNTIAGRMQARVIALTFGHWLTKSELDAAAKCLRQAQARGATQ